MESIEITDSNVLSLLIDKVIYTIILKNYYNNKNKTKNFIYDDEILYIHLGIYYSNLTNEENDIEAIQKHLKEIQDKSYEINDVKNPFDKLIFKFYNEYTIDDTINYLSFDENNNNYLKYFLLGMIIGMNYSGITTFNETNTIITTFTDNLKKYLKIDSSYDYSDESDQIIQQNEFFNLKTTNIKDISKNNTEYSLKLLNINNLLKKILDPYEFNYNFTMDYKKSSITVDEFNKMFYEYISNSENDKISDNYLYYLQLLLLKLRFCESFDNLSKINIDIDDFDKTTSEVITDKTSEDSQNQIINSELDSDQLIDDDYIIQQISEQESEPETDDNLEDNLYDDYFDNEFINFDSDDEPDQHNKPYIPKYNPSPWFNNSEFRYNQIPEINTSINFNASSRRSYKHKPYQFDKNIINLENRKIEHFENIDTSDSSIIDSIEFKETDSDTESICVKPNKKHYKTKEINKTFNEHTINKLLKLCKAYHKDYVSNVNIQYNNKLLFIILLIMIINMMMNIAYFYYK